MKRPVSRILICLGILLFVFCLAPSAGADDDAAAVRTVTVEGRASLALPPDQVRLTIGVTTQAPRAQEAAAENAAAMEKVVQTLKAALGEAGSLRTVGYRVSPRYEWNSQTRRNQFVGFEAVNQVEATSADIAAVGSLLDAAMAAGANSVKGPAWELKDPSAARIQAQAAALKDAEAQARALARAAGLELGRVLTIRTGGAGRPVPMMRALAGNRAAKATPMEPGRITADSVVSCVFELVPKP